MPAIWEKSVWSTKRSVKYFSLITVCATLDHYKNETIADDKNENIWLARYKQALFKHIKTKIHPVSPQAKIMNENDYGINDPELSEYNNPIS